MNKILYSFLFLYSISSFGLLAQSKKKYHKTFTVNKNTQLNFDTQNIDVTFKIWDRDEVKVDFVVDFNNYSDEEIRHISNGIVVSATMQSTMGDSNYLVISNASPTSIGRLSYQIKSGEIHIDNMFATKDEPNRYRSVRDINKMISNTSSGFDGLDGYVVFENDSVALKNIKNSRHKGIQSIRATYEIYVPDYIMLNVNVNRANFHLDGKFVNKIVGSFQESNLLAEELNNAENSIGFMNGSVKVKKMIGGDYLFKNVTEGLIGQLENTILQTEFSKFTIGEITKNVRFRDFKSDYFIYNLGENFTSIDMICEYSDIKMYTKKDQKYYMKAIGNNAVLNDNSAKIIMQPNKDGKKYTMFTRGEDTPEIRKNTFTLDLVHGFVTLFYNK